jgi:hypothetical protein
VGGSSEEEDESKNVWLITREQYSYYVTQFRAMQPNPRGVIPGTQVRQRLLLALLHRLDSRRKNSLRSPGCRFRNCGRYGSSPT